MSTTTAARPRPRPAQTTGKVMALTALLLIVGGLAFLLAGRPLGALCVLLMGATTALWAIAVLLTTDNRRSNDRQGGLR